PGRTTLWPRKSREKNSTRKLKVSLLNRDTGNKGFRAGRLHRPVSLPASATRLRPTTLRGRRHPLFGVEGTPPIASARCLRALRPAPQILVRAPCRPVKAGRSRRRQRSQFGSSAARGQPCGLIPPVPFLANAGVVSGANPSNEVGCNDAARRPGSWWAHFFSPWRCVRPWLPQFGRAAPRHARLHIISHI